MTDTPCVVCGRDTPDQTCTHCLGATRRNLIRIEQLHALLPTELEGRAGAAQPMDPNGHIRGEGNPLPGGDIMVMLGPGATRPHDDHDDADSTIGILERWDTDWRITFNDGAGTTQATLTSCMIYLLRRLSHAAQKHPTFAEFADDIRNHRHRMETALRLTPQRCAVPCLTCSARALQRPRPRADGRVFEWQCGKCHRNYTQEEFWMAVRQHGEAI